MAVDLVEHITAGGDSAKLWIDFKAYTKKLLLAEGENPWANPAAYMSYYGQAHGLVKADVVVLDVWDLFHHWMLDDDEAIPSMAGKKRITVAAKVMLEAYGPRELLAEVLTAVNNNYGSLPIALVLPSPRSLLIKAHKAANNEDVEPEESHIDTASMYMADYLRYFSETGLSGVLLMEDPASMPASTEELSWYQPIYNVVKHYRWATGIHLPFSGDGFSVPDDVDFSIVPISSPIAGSSLGVDVSSQLWDADGDIESIKSVNAFKYVSIPEDATPEVVLDTLSNLRG